MFIDKDSIQVKIEGMNDYMSLGEYLVEVKYGFNKLYAGDSGRNLAGAMTSTLIGEYPKLTIQFGPLTRSQMETLSPILQAERQWLKYYDPIKRTIIAIETYTGDYEVTNKRIISNGAKNEGFSCAFISVRKRP